ncbi:MAG TPA: hypothetical protein P5514_13145 [Bacteroidales bacterium]|nr:hypothetical protein [Bacteroidales bacterium]
MKKTLLSLFICIISANVLIAQETPDFVDVTWSSEMDESKSNTLEEIVGHNEAGYFIVKQEKKDYFLEQFNNDLVREKSVLIDLDKLGKKRSFEKIILFGEGLYLFTSELSTKEMEKKFFVQSIDEETLEPIKDEMLFVKIPYKAYFLKKENLFTFVVSEDKSKLLAYYNSPYDFKGREQFGFNVFNSQMEEIWYDFMELPIKEKQFIMEDHLVDNNGDVFLMGKKYIGSKPSGYILYAYFDHGQALAEIPIELPGKYVNGANMVFSPDNKIIVAGFYSDHSTSGISGTFFTTVDLKTQKASKINYQEFDMELITKNLKKGEENKLNRKDEKGKDADMYEYDMRDMVFRPNGEILLIGEQYFIESVERMKTDGSGSETKRLYNYNDIVVVKLDAGGKIIWGNKIAKRQESKEDGGYFSSYIMAHTDQNLYFIFNDHPKNLESEETGKIYNFEKGHYAMASVVKMDDEGNIQREGLFKTTDKEIVLVPKVSKEISAGELIIYGERYSNQRIARLLFK